MPENLLREWGPILTPVVAATLWLGRLEWRSRTNAKAVDKEEEARKEDVARLEGQIRDSHMDTNQRIDRLEDNMNAHFKEVQGDIKTLLQRGN